MKKALPTLERDCGSAFAVDVLGRLEELGNRLDGLALRVHVPVGVDADGDLRAVVAGELLHDLRVDSAHRE